MTAGEAGPTSITPAELKRRLDAGERIAIVDTRNRDEIDQWRIEHPNLVFRHVPYAKFLSASVSGNPAKLVSDGDGDRAGDVDDDGDVDGPLVAVCPRGEASEEVAAILRNAGIEAANLAGGMHGWARLYEAKEFDPERVDTDGATVVQYSRPSSGCLAYLVVSAGEAMVIDPLRAFTDRYATDARERDATVEYVLDTHVHADHVSGLRELSGSTGATPLMSGQELDRGVTYAEAVRAIEDGTVLDVGNVTLEVIATPGHTTGMVSVRIGDVLFVGDTLFVEGVPRPDLQHGDDGARELARTLYETITRRLAVLADDIVIAPGHYAPDTTTDSATTTGTDTATTTGTDTGTADDGTYTARLGELRDRLSVFTRPRDEWVDAVVSDTSPRPANFERIVDVNLGRADADDEDAFELELGPNNCAASPDAAD